MIFALLKWIKGRFSAAPRTAAKWEAVKDPTGDMWRVRWSEAHPNRGLLYVRHFGGTNINEHLAKREAENLNCRGRKPWEYMEWRGL